MDEDGNHRESTLPWAIYSVDDIRAYLKTGEWELVDEYGEVYPDWEKKIDELVAWDGGKSDWNKDHPDEPVEWDVNEHDIYTGSGYRDKDNNIFSDYGGFC